jgi:phosphatidylserine decarboxylase
MRQALTSFVLIVKKPSFIYSCLFQRTGIEIWMSSRGLIRRVGLPSRLPPPGLPLIFGTAFTTLILALLGLTALALIGLAATFAICGFFRDPDRVIPAAPGAVVSPADGKVIAAALVDGGPYFDG